MTDIPNSGTLKTEGACAYVDLDVMEMPDTDLWALMAVLNMNWSAIWTPGIRIDQIAQHTGWGVDKTSKVLKRAVKQKIIGVVSHGRGLRIVRYVQNRYIGGHV